jgi:hypothetical protein
MIRNSSLFRHISLCRVVKASVSERIIASIFKVSHWAKQETDMKRAANRVLTVFCFTRFYLCITIQTPRCRLSPHFTAMYLNRCNSAHNRISTVELSVGPRYRVPCSVWLRAGWPKGWSSSPGPDGAHPASWITGAIFPGVMRQGGEADHSLPSSSEVKKIWTYISNLPYVFMAS